MSKIPKWMKSLTKAERDHIHKDAGCRTKRQFQRTVAQQEEWRDEAGRNPQCEPCWDCRFIAKKLGWID